MRSILVLSITTPLLFACISSEVTDKRYGATAVAPGDAVVILDDRTDFEHFPACVANVMRDNGSGLSLISEREFRDALFPWFTREFDETALGQLLDNPDVKGRLSDLRARYLVKIGGRTTSVLQKAMRGGGEPTPSTDPAIGTGALNGAASSDDAGEGSKGTMICGAGVGAVGCFGLVTWGRRTELFAKVWNLSTGAYAGTVSARSSGTNVMPAVVLPVPFIAPTETSACNALGRNLVRFLTATSYGPR